MFGGGAGSILDMINRLKQNNQYIRSIHEKKKQWQAGAGRERHGRINAKLLDKKMSPLERREHEERIEAIRRRERSQTRLFVILGLAFSAIITYLLFLKRW